MYNRYLSSLTFSNERTLQVPPVTPLIVYVILWSLKSGRASIPVAAAILPTT